MIIPQEDFEWLRDQTNSVKTLFMECWMSDPYGSCFMQLNHSLSYKSFMRGKKAIEEKGLFLFRPKKSMIPNHHKETVCWEVFNLHGARRTDFWLNLNSEESPPEDKKKPDLNSEESPPEDKKKPDLNIQKASFKLNLDGQKSPRKDKDVLEKRQKNSRDGQECPSEKSEPIATRRSQNPPVGSQECLSNSPKELLETLATDLSRDESDRDTALEERVTSASPNEEKTEAIRTNPTEVPTDLVNQSNSDSKQIAQSAGKEASGALTKKSTEEVLNQPYEFDWRNGNSIERCKGQNLAIDTELTNETCRKSLKDAIALSKAISMENSKKDKIKRFGYERNPMSFSDVQALEEYKRELEF